MISVHEGNGSCELRSYGIPVREGLQKAGDVIVLRAELYIGSCATTCPPSIVRARCRNARRFAESLERVSLSDVILTNIIAVRSLLSGSRGASS